MGVTEREPDGEGDGTSGESAASDPDERGGDGVADSGPEAVSDPDRDDAPAVADATDLRFVGAATAAVLDEAGIDPADVPAKRVSHADLLAAGVNPGVAAKIRREHSLAWSFEGGADLDRRAEQVRGLGDDERAWVAASTGDWQTDRVDGEGGPPESAAADGESAWQQRSRPTPVTELGGVGEKRAETLARGGINSVRSMALADPAAVAESLDLPEGRVREWREQAREML